MDCRDIDEEKTVNVIILMAGEGKRVKNKDCRLPKPLIDIDGYPMFYYAVKSIEKNITKPSISFVTLKRHEEEYDIHNTIMRFVPMGRIQTIDRVLNGPVLSALEGIKLLNNNPVAFCDCDLAFSINNFDESINKLRQGEVDAILLSFESSNPAYSYIEYDNDNLCKRIVEKKVISDRAVCGMYFFKSVDMFVRYASKIIKNVEHECYMSSVIEKMIEDGKKVLVSMVDQHLSYGTTEEIADLDIEKLRLLVGEKKEYSCNGNKV